MVEKVKKILNPFYTDRCNVYEKTVKEGRFTTFEEKLLYESIPCRVSAKSYMFGESAGNKKDNVLKVSKKVKLFFPPQYKFKAGCSVKLWREGNVTCYSNSGEMNTYPTHNEVMVEIEKDYA